MRHVVLSAYNRATYLDQTQAVVQEKRVAKTLVCACDLSHFKACVGACACNRTPPERV